MKLGLVVDGHSGFISDLLADWQNRYETELFSFQEIDLPVSKGRVNQWRLKRALQQFLDRNDVVFFEWAGLLLIVASHLSTRTPILTRLHSWELYEFAPHVCWKKVDRIILVSQAMQKKFTELFPEEAVKSRTVYCGKSLEAFKLESHQFQGNIGMLCDLVPIKRVYDVLLTLHDLRQKGYVLNLHIGGEARDGADNTRYFVSMQRAVEKLSLGDQVTFHGWVDNVPVWLQNIDIFISNSFWEGQQNALLEAMAAGCYCLSHFWDGAEEILPSEYLYVSDSDLQQMIIEYCQWPENRKRHHQLSLRSVVEAKFDVEHMKSRYRELIEELGTNGTL